MNRRELINKIIEKKRQKERGEEVLNEMAEKAFNDMMRPKERRKGKRGWRESEDIDDDSGKEDFGMNIKGRRRREMARRETEEQGEQGFGVGAEESKDGEDGEEEDFGKGNELRRERREMARREREKQGEEAEASVDGDKLSSMKWGELKSIAES